MKDSKTLPTDLENESPLLQNSNQTQSYRAKMKYPALILACLLSIGAYFCYDNPAALESHLTDPHGTFKLSHVNYSLLYSVYAFPNTILPFFGGFLVDKMGVRIGLLFFSFLLTIGQLLIFFGGITTTFPLLLVGRVLFGIGSESLNVTQTTIIAHWFEGSGISFAIGLNIAIARIGSVMNSALTPLLYSLNNGYFLPLFIGLLLCVASFLCGVVLCYIDRKAENLEKEKQMGHEGEQETEKIKLSDLKGFSLLFWSLLLTCILTYGSFYTFNANANDILYKRFNIPNEIAGLYLMVVFLIAALVTPFFGILFDRVGKRSIGLLIALSLLIFALLMVTFFPSHINAPLILVPLVCLGVFYPTFAAAFWPCIPRVVEKKTLGSAYGLLMSFQNLGIAVTPLIFAAIQNSTFGSDEYFKPLLYLIFQAALSLLAAVLVKVADSKTGRKLDIHAIKATN